MNTHTAEKVGKLIIHTIMIVICIACIYPFLIILGTSFQSEESIISSGYKMIPENFDFTAYRMILSDPKQLIASYRVTIMTTVVGTIVGLWVTTAYAFAISRRDYAYRKSLSFFIFFTMLFNGGLVPSYILITRWLNIGDTMLALITPLLISGWYVLLMKGFLQALPDSLFESAKIDGANELRIFIQIVLPLSLPALATVGLFFVLQYWNEWMLTLLYIESDDLLKLQYLLIRVLKNMEFLNSADAVKYGVVQPGMVSPTLSARMAMCVLAAGPMLVVFPFFQRFFVRGLTVGSVKG